MHFNKKRYDKNCIKKHKLYMKGKLNSVNSIEISMKKGKLLGKQLNSSFNDIILAITSKTLK